MSRTIVDSDQLLGMDKVPSSMVVVGAGVIGIEYDSEPVGNKLGDLQPIGICTIPEVSFVGRTENELTSEKVPFEVGISRYRELLMIELQTPPHQDRGRAENRRHDRHDHERNCRVHIRVNRPEGGRDKWDPGSEVGNH